jgi:hypothetical protein
LNDGGVFFRFLRETARLLEPDDRGKSLLLEEDLARPKYARRAPSAPEHTGLRRLKGCWENRPASTHFSKIDRVKPLHSNVEANHEVSNSPAMEALAAVLLDQPECFGIILEKRSL